MPQQTGTARPGGRTARTRAAAHDAVRALLAEGATELTIPAIAERSGIHATTLYRRWRTVEALVLDVTVEEVNDVSPVPATGDLHADLDAYVRQLLRGLQQPSRLGFLRAMMAATAQAGDPVELEGVVAPRMRQFQAMLDASGTTALEALNLVELVIAPAYLWAQLGQPLDPDADADRLVANVLAVVAAAERA